MRIRVSYAIALGVLSFIFTDSARGDIIPFTEFNEWQSAAGAFHEIGFAEFLPGTHLTDQYSGLGVEFSGPTFVDSGSYVDGVGIKGVKNDIFLDFSIPVFEFGVDYPGVIRIEALSEGEQVFIGDFFITGFGGIVSDTPFDSIRLSAFDGPPIFADNIYFTIPAPGALALFGLAVLPGAGRRRDY